jgi:hypothetical protein
MSSDLGYTLTSLAIGELHIKMTTRVMAMTFISGLDMALSYRYNNTILTYRKSAQTVA